MMPELRVYTRQPREQPRQGAVALLLTQLRPDGPMRLIFRLIGALAAVAVLYGCDG
jgi:hypothetical protein